MPGSLVLKPHRHTPLAFSLSFTALKGKVTKIILNCVEGLTWLCFLKLSLPFLKLIGKLMLHTVCMFSLKHHQFKKKLPIGDVHTPEFKKMYNSDFHAILYIMLPQYTFKSRACRYCYQLKKLEINHLPMRTERLFFLLCVPLPPKYNQFFSKRFQFKNLKDKSPATLHYRQRLQTSPTEPGSPKRRENTCHTTSLPATHQK